MIEVQINEKPNSHQHKEKGPRWTHRIAQPGKEPEFEVPDGFQGHLIRYRSFNGMEETCLEEVLTGRVVGATKPQRKY